MTAQVWGLRAISAVAATTVAAAFLSPGVGRSTGSTSSAWHPGSSFSAAPRQQDHVCSHEIMRGGGAWRQTMPLASTTKRTSRLVGLRMADAAGDGSLDTIINGLKEAEDAQTLTLRVSKCVQQVAQPAFFLRLAEMAESTTDDKERAALETLATRVTGVLETLVEFAEEKMDDSSALLQIVVTSAAEKNGEFLVPLSEERLAAVRQSIRIHRDQLDNNFLATVQAWMEKSGREEGMEGMVVILQKILQVYAAEAILEGQGGSTVDASSPSSEEAGKGFGEGPSIPADASVKRTPARLLLDEILTTDADKWNGILAGLSSPSSGQGMTGGVTKDGILGAIQVAVESVILQQENGSMAQRVQAEFLSELCKRIEAACPEKPPGMGMLE